MSHGSYLSPESDQQLPTPTQYGSSFSESDPQVIIDKLLESVQDERLDRIRSITFSSLNTEDPFNSTRGVFRGLQIIFSLGKGQFLKHAFSFSPEWLESIDFKNDKVQGSSLKSLADNNSAYSRLYSEYLKIYSSKPDFRSDLIGLCNVEDLRPASLRPLVKLLLLIVVSSKF